jgi:cytochrome c biogenesis protein CcmG, thiol:disulfide interchange protein DsbE
MVNFWASWCVPCRQEVKALNRLQEERGGPRFTVVGVDSNDLSPDAKAFVKRYGVSYPQLRDGQGKLADEFGTTGVPESYLFDPQGRLKEARPGPIDEQILRERFLPLIPPKGKS